MQELHRSLEPVDIDASLRRNQKMIRANLVATAIGYGVAAITVGHGVTEYIQTNAMGESTLKHIAVFAFSTAAGILANKNMINNTNTVYDIESLGSEINTLQDGIDTLLLDEIGLLDNNNIFGIENPPEV